MSLQPQRLRASDQDRHEAVLALSDHHAEGRLDLAEFTARMERAQEAVYLDDLDPLFVDLPTRSARPAAATAGQRRHRRPSVPPWLPVAALLVLGLSVAAVANGHFPWWLIPFAWFVAARLHARHRASYRALGMRSARGW